MRVIIIVGVVFIMIGIGSLIGGVFLIKSTNNFVKNSEITNGRIVDIVIRTREDSEGKITKTRVAVIEFEDKNGNTFEFTSSSSSTKVGDNVEVRYLPDNPDDAKINSLFDIWGGPFMALICGIFFFGGGIFSLWIGYFGEVIKENRARNYTKEVKAKIVKVSENTSISSNGKSPFVIEAKWLDPDTNKIHIFRSKNFWYDPSEFLLGREEVIVKVDPTNIKKYWMDVSFLPKKA